MVPKGQIATAATGGVLLMAEPERWQVSTDAAEVYESCFVPAIFGAWAGPVADAAGIRRGDRVLVSQFAHVFPGPRGLAG